MQYLTLSLSVIIADKLPEYKIEGDWLINVITKNPVLLNSGLVCVIPFHFSFIPSFEICISLAFKFNSSI